MFHMYAFFFAAGITFKINKSETFIQFLKKNISSFYVGHDEHVNTSDTW